MRAAAHIIRHVATPSARTRAAVIDALRADADRLRERAPDSERHHRKYQTAHSALRAAQAALGLAPSRAIGRPDMTDGPAIVARMGADVRSLRIDPAYLERFHLRRFGWTDAQIDAWFESACESASRSIAL